MRSYPLFITVAALILTFSPQSLAQELPGNGCTTLGTTQISQDGVSMIACLRLAANNPVLVWKSMTPLASEAGARPILQTGQSDLRLGDVLTEGNNRNGAAPGYGKFILFSGGPAMGTAGGSENNTPLWIARHNVGFDQSELRVSLGNNPAAIKDAFAIGLSSGDGTVWLPRFSVDASGSGAFTGTLKIGQSNAGCSERTEGSLRYNPANKFVEVCNGRYWGNMTSAGVKVRTGGWKDTTTMCGDVLIPEGTGTVTHEISYFFGCHDAKSRTNFQHGSFTGDGPQQACCTNNGIKTASWISIATPR
ncbi:MAG: hypothetical protein FWF24_03070 [Alphaproteobacteria bacterium]|nr:hypothetical protein [Alphaproteobacteria bacterium]